MKIRNIQAVKKSKRYDQAFKVQAVQLSYEQGSILNAAWELGVSCASISRWRKKYATEWKDSHKQYKNQKSSKEQVENDYLSITDFDLLWYMFGFL